MNYVASLNLATHISNGTQFVDIYISLAGFLVGGIVGVTGVGGGSLMTPFLLAYGISPSIAVGTDLLYAALTKVGAIGVYHAERAIRWRLVGLLALGSLPATAVALWLLTYLEAQGFNHNRLITQVLSVSLVLTALVILLRNRLLNLAQLGTHIPQHYLPKITIAAGVLIGFLVTLSSVGAGALGAAILLLLYPKLSARNIVGVDLAHAVLLTFVAGLGHMRMGSVDLVLLANLLLGSIPGIVLGSRLGRRFSDQRLRDLLASVLLLIGLGLVVKTL